jgi:hypothetical protein
MERTHHLTPPSLKLPDKSFPCCLKKGNGSVQPLTGSFLLICLDSDDRSRSVRKQIVYFQLTKALFTAVGQASTSPKHQPPNMHQGGICSNLNKVSSHAIEVRGAGLGAES